MKNNLNSYNGYHRISQEEINRFKRYLPKLKSALSKFQQMYLGKQKSYIYVIAYRKIKKLDMNFEKKHFMHLCGVKYNNGGAQSFFKSLKNQELKLDKLLIKDDSSTFQKLDVIDNIDLLNGLNTKVSIGKSFAGIHYDNMIKSKKQCLGIAIDKDDNGIGYPLSLLNLSKRDTKSLTSFDVVAILEENKLTHKRICLCKRSNCDTKIDKYIEEHLNA